MKCSPQWTLDELKKMNKATLIGIHKAYLVDVKRIHYPISGTEIREMESEKDRARWII